MPTHLSDKPGYFKNFKPTVPKFSWGGLLAILFMILALVGMAIYQSYK